MSVVALTSLLVVAPLSQLQTTLGRQEWLILQVKAIRQEVSSELFCVLRVCQHSALCRPIHVLVSQVVWWKLRFVSISSVLRGGCGLARLTVGLLSRGRYSGQEPLLFRCNQTRPPACPPHSQHLGPHDVNSTQSSDPVVTGSWTAWLKCFSGNVCMNYVASGPTESHLGSHLGLFQYQQRFVPQYNLALFYCSCGHNSLIFASNLANSEGFAVSLVIFPVWALTCFITILNGPTARALEKALARFGTKYTTVLTHNWGLRSEMPRDEKLNFNSCWAFLYFPHWGSAGIEHLLGAG